ncbi:MAG: IS110 family transposase [Alphaproteobacteria bacterium]|nr:IS110 family transposase [Alphaproteobacteria bacterium]
MDDYAALDVSMETTCLCGMDAKGRIIGEGKVATDAAQIAKWLTEKGGKWTLVGLEAGPLSNWLHGELKALGFPVVLIETRNAKAAMAAMRNKTDRKDARGLAHLLRTGLFRAVVPKSMASQEIRTLLSARATIRRQLLDVENSVRGLLKNYGVRLGKGARVRLERLVSEALSGRERLAAAITPLVTVHGVLRRELAKLEGKVRALAKTDPVTRRLMTAPGVGPIVALTYRSTIDDPGRFRHSRDVGAHIGLTPKRYESGETRRDGGISKAGDRILRAALYEAATTLLTRSATWSTLKSWGVRQAKVIGSRRARVAVARKLAVVLHRMWADGTDFRFAKPESATA